MQDDHFAIPLMSGKYLIRNKWINTYLRICDKLLSFVPFRKVKQDVPVKKILLAISGHMGDAILATSILPVLRKRWPSASIDCVGSSWMRPILHKHPEIGTLWRIDHWIENREAISIWKKLIRYYLMRFSAIWHIRRERYSLAIDLSPYFPNKALVLFQSRIPVRIGYSSAGFSRLYTHALDWKYVPKHMVDYYFDLLRPLGIGEQYRRYVKPSLPPLIRKNINLPKSYIVIHPGSGNSQKEWPDHFWLELVQRLERDNITVVVTGKGQREGILAQKITENSAVINLTNILSWDEYRLVIALAKLVVAVDSVAGHIAAVYDIDAITLFNGINNSHHWKPLSKKNTLLFYPMPCIPCHRNTGCRERLCMTGIKPKEVHAAICKKLFD